MKRLLAAFICALMLVSVIVVDTGAAGTLIFNDDFSTGFAPRNWFTSDGGCRYTWDETNKTLNSYGDAPVLQSRYTSPYNKKWEDFYFSVDVQVKADDDREELWPDFTFVRIWYRDQFELETPGAVYFFSICIQTGEATVTKEHTYKYTDDDGILKEHSINEVIAGPVSINDTIEVGEDAEWFSMGLRVTDGRMQCYYNETLLLDLQANEDDEKLGGVALKNIDATVGTQASPFIFFNNGNWIQLDNFEVWSADYDFVTDILYGDANNDGIVNMLDAAAIMRKVAGWTVEILPKNGDVNVDGAVNLNDASLILKHAANWDVVLGPAE